MNAKYLKWIVMMMHHAVTSVDLIAVYANRVSVEMEKIVVVSSTFVFLYAPTGIQLLHPCDFVGHSTRCSEKSLKNYQMVSKTWVGGPIYC